MSNIYAPKYIQIRDYLIQLIENKKLSSGKVIPSERELSDKFGVSRMTVRQAITSLVSNGLLERKQGAGTYVTEPKVEHDIRFLVSFTESSLRRGINPAGKIVLFDQLEADVKLSQSLQVSLGKKVYRLIRVRYTNHDPLVLERCFFPVERYPGIERLDLENRSLYHVWKDEYGISFGRMRQTLEPVSADEAEAQLLDVPVGFPLMLIERVTFDAQGIPIEYAKDVHRSDRSRFVSDVSISPDWP